jgi:2-succinyl-6-hydroxy-2,4-cyclohexadiene-1-carboxylate synthase
MILDINDVKYHVHAFGDNSNTLTPLILLHGFSGSGAVFKSLQEAVYPRRSFALDLIGHGKTDSPSDEKRYSVENQLKDLHQIIKSLNIAMCNLLGYSMGGRLAIRFALQNPRLIKHLVLESTNSGIEDTSELEERILRDAKLANEIRADFPTFLQKWNRLPLFNSPDDAPETTHKLFGDIQKNQNPEGLANSLTGFGAGSMQPVANKLHEISADVLVITGSADYKYTEMWKSLINNFQKGTHKSIRNAGHRVHLDRPDAYIQTILQFIKNT